MIFGYLIFDAGRKYLKFQYQNFLKRPMDNCQGQF
jgi:hypothetical protein